MGHPNPYTTIETVGSEANTTCGGIRGRGGVAIAIQG